MSNTPEPAPDPVLDAYRLYEEDGQIHFIRHVSSYFGSRGSKRLYTYYTNTRQLWKIYVRNKKKWMRVGTYSGASYYIRMNRLKPVWPKHMMVDKGL